MSEYREVSDKEITCGADRESTRPAAEVGIHGPAVARHQSKTSEVVVLAPGYSPTAEVAGEIFAYSLEQQRRLADERGPHEFRDDDFI